jgi:hypothetical protein
MNQDSDLLRKAKAFASMQAWVDAAAARAGEGLLWDEGFQRGDWLDPTAPPDRPWEGATDPHLVATAYLARSAELLARAAELLRRDDEAAGHRLLADGVRRAFNDEYVTPAGRVASDSQTALALAIEFALLATEEQRRRAGRAWPSWFAQPAIASPQDSSARRWCATPCRTPARATRLSAPAPACMPVLALSGDDGRHDGLGALGQHAAGRQCESGRDDLVQPPRARPSPTGCTARWPVWPRLRRATAACWSARSQAVGCATPPPRMRRRTAAPRCAGS